MDLLLRVNRSWLGGDHPTGAKWPAVTIDGRAVVEIRPVPPGGWALLYPTEEALFIVDAPDSLGINEVLAELPRVAWATGAPSPGPSGSCPVE